MKREMLLVSLVVVGFCASSVLALTPMGPTTPSLKKGQWAFGAEYADVDMKLSSSPRPGGFFDVDMEINQYSAVIRRGITDNWEGSARIGFADMECDTFDGTNRWDGDDDDVLLGLGTKATLWEQTTFLKWGILGQATWAEFDGSAASSAGTFGKFEIEYTEWQIAVGPTWTPPEWDWLTVYGGVFYHDVDGYYTSWTPGPGQAPLRERDDFGLYVGGQVAASGNLCLTIEYMDTGDADALVLGAMWVPNGL